jgi:hypothetical protein
MVVTISDDARQLVWAGEMCRHGSTREPDLELTFTRID